MASHALGVVYRISEDLVAREIHGEFIIIPITAEAGAAGDEILSLNDTGREIWSKIDGNRTVDEIVQLLSANHRASSAEIKKDVLGFLKELKKRKIVIETKRSKRKK